MKKAPARKLAAAGIAGAGAAIGAAAFVIVRGIPGLLYAAGIGLAAFVGAVAVVAGGSEEVVSTEDTVELEVVQPPRPPRWRRKKHIIAELEAELATTGAELEDHRRALANLGAQLARETEAARANAERLERQIHELETERDALLELVAAERDRFERTLDDLGGGIGRHGNEIAELERELEALITR